MFWKSKYLYLDVVWSANVCDLLTKQVYIDFTTVNCLIAEILNN